MNFAARVHAENLANRRRRHADITEPVTAQLAADRGRRIPGRCELCGSRTKARNYCSAHAWAELL